MTLQGLYELVSPSDLIALRALLTQVDLTLAGVDAPSVRLRVERDATGSLRGSSGFELSGDGRHALIRSVAVAVAVAPDRRGAGAGSRLARYALAEATAAGVTRAWLFSRRSGTFWQKLGFDSADRYALAAAMPDAHQVRHFTRTGQLDREVAWTRSLGGR